MEILSVREVIYRTAHLRRLRRYTPRCPVSCGEWVTLNESELLTEELALAKKAKVMTRVPFRPRDYGTSKELTRRGIDPELASDEDPLASDNDLSNHWEVAKLLKHSELIDGSRSFLIKWKNHSAAHNSWEPLENISAPDLLRQYYVSNALPLTELSPSVLPSPQPQPSSEASDSDDEDAFLSADEGDSTPNPPAVAPAPEFSRPPDVHAPLPSPPAPNVVLLPPPARAHSNQALAADTAPDPAPALRHRLRSAKKGVVEHR